jgi:hypothetical protein
MAKFEYRMIAVGIAISITFILLLMVIISSYNHQHLMNTTKVNNSVINISDVFIQNKNVPIDNTTWLTFEKNRNFSPINFFLNKSFAIANDGTIHEFKNPLFRLPILENIDLTNQTTEKKQEIF